MKKLFAKAFLGLCALGTSTVAFAQDAADAATAVEGGIYRRWCRLYEFGCYRFDFRFGFLLRENYLLELS